MKLTPKSHEKNIIKENIFTTGSVMNIKGGITES